VAAARRRGGCDDNGRQCDGDGRFVVVLSSSDVCRKDDRPAGEAPQAKRTTTRTKMNDDNKDNDRRSLSSRLGNGSYRTRREHKDTVMDMHTTIKQITRRGA
jgi:hypothetical protein